MRVTYHWHFKTLLQILGPIQKYVRAEIRRLDGTVVNIVSDERIRTGTDDALTHLTLRVFADADVGPLTSQCHRLTSEANCLRNCARSVFCLFFDRRSNSRE